MKEIGVSTIEEPSLEQEYYLESRPDTSSVLLSTLTFPSFISMDKAWEMFMDIFDNPNHVKMTIALIWVILTTLIWWNYLESIVQNITKNLQDKFTSIEHSLESAPRTMQKKLAILALLFFAVRIYAPSIQFEEIIDRVSYIPWLSQAWEYLMTAWKESIEAFKQIIHSPHITWLLWWWVWYVFSKGNILKRWVTSLGAWYVWHHVDHLVDVWNWIVAWQVEYIRAGIAAALSYLLAYKISWKHIVGAAAWVTASSIGHDPNQILEAIEYIKAYFWWWEW